MTRNEPATDEVVSLCAAHRAELPAPRPAAGSPRSEQLTRTRRGARQLRARVAPAGRVPGDRPRALLPDREPAGSAARLRTGPASLRRRLPGAGGAAPAGLRMWHTGRMAHDSTTSHTLTVGERGRLVIPAELRRALGIGPGSTLLARVEDGARLVLEDRRSVARRLRGSWGPMPDGRSAVDELLAERRAEAALEEAELSGDGAAIAAARESLSRAGAPHATGRKAARKRAG